jgi:hypothetical protein
VSEEIMELPDPEDVKGLMSAMSYKVQCIVDEVVKLAADYGVHGRTIVFGEFSFQVTRISEKWSVYITSSNWTRDLTGAKLDEKLLFLEHSDEFVKDYRDRIVALYGQLRKLAQKR